MKSKVVIPGLPCVLATNKSGTLLLRRDQGDVGDVAVLLDNRSAGRSADRIVKSELSPPFF